MHSEPYPWQLDATEAILLGLDSIVIAGTGSGKTMPFMMPLTLDPKKKIIIISPLKVLQEDQVRIIFYFPHPNTYSPFPG
jgi:bloom syndrome protein